MRKLVGIAALLLVLLMIGTPAFAQDETAPANAANAGQLGPGDFFIFSGAAFGSGLIIIGAAWGIGKIGAAAVESMARQPEVAGNVNTAMIIAAALIEGVTFFALIVCLLTLLF